MQTCVSLTLSGGPPDNGIKLSSGDVAYEWSLSYLESINSEKSVGSGQIDYCRVRAIVSPDRILRGFSTEGPSNILGESVCAERLTLKRSFVGEGVGRVGSLPAASQIGPPQLGK